MILANSVWTAAGVQLKAAYVEQMQTLFQATAREAVHGAQDVNDWVADVTRGMIKTLVQGDNFKSILANAIYFKGLWEHAFKKDLTQPATFTTASGAAKQVDMMQHEFAARDNIHGARKEGLYDAVVLPYQGGAFSAVALLPAPGVTVAQALRDWAEVPQELAPMGALLVKLPRFKASTSLTLGPVLKSLGVRAAFTPGVADFSRMADPGLFVSDIVHKAVVEVDEEGTVAAAATAVIMCLCVPLPPAELVFDRPFAFIIRHNPTGLPAFIGAVNDPTKD
ncbi:hypothetical protein GPECTOR_2g1181 [Gonium pectorale]|uniref:Serpin domain-containing protein n=1 Tax=Gonium pectorale TaxID=33097 RepID=A0A150H0L9_GONPE|nr:hypothetical protein GPECTOR_2g1181 [Gonium pectorale]|eukprot:KXZ55631.1 hypothetical protein GPECTOR_2g1181 [Gonium pectorale]